MDSKQAIAMIGHIREYIVENQADHEYAEPIDMAIQALETIEKGVVPVDWHNDVYETIQKRYIDLLERTRWIPVSERLPTKEDANSKGKVIAWCTSFNGTEVDLNWRLVETDGVITHWRVGMEPPQEVE